MKSLFYKFYHHTLLGNFFRLAYNRLPFYLSDKNFIRFRYHKRFGTFLNLQNPQTLNEKINWLKIHDRTPLHTLCADKYAVREHVGKKIGQQYLIPLYYHTKNPKEIVPENLGQFPCIIKTNHDSGGGIFVHEPDEINWCKIQDELTERMEKNYYEGLREWQYKDIEPRIIVEKLLLDGEGKVPMDYKIHCFNGQPEIVQIDLDRFSDHKRNLYDTEWNLMPFTWSMWENDNPLWPNGKKVTKPKNLDLIIELAKILSADFIFARIDFYEVGQRIYFGEITFHPGSGFEKIHPEEWALTWGKRLRLPPKTK